MIVILGQNMVIIFYRQWSCWMQVRTCKSIAHIACPPAVALHWFGWESFYIFESSNKSYTQGIFIYLVQGNVRYYDTRQDHWETYEEIRIKKIDHPESKGDCIICNYNSSLHNHQFIGPEVSKAWVFGFNTWTDATGLYQDEDWTWLFLPYSWRSIYIL